MNEMLSTFGRIGVYSFGGPAAQIALMHRVLVEEKRWLNEQEFLNALSFAMLLPGPEAMQLATYAGWQKGGVPGGLLAGGLFVLPGAVVMAILATIYALFGNVPLIDAIFLGVQATVVAIVIEAPFAQIDSDAFAGADTSLLDDTRFVEGHHAGFRTDDQQPEKSDRR